MHRRLTNFWPEGAVAGPVRLFNVQQAGLTDPYARSAATSPPATPGAFSDQLRSAMQQLAQLGENVVQAAPIGNSRQAANARPDLLLSSPAYPRPDEAQAASAQSRRVAGAGPRSTPEGNRANEETKASAVAPKDDAAVPIAPPAGGAGVAAQGEPVAAVPAALAPARGASGVDGAGPVSAAPGVAGTPAAAGVQRPAQSRPMALSDFPRPIADNGRGMHWIPTTHQPPEIVDRYVDELKAMKVKWAVFLNEGTQIGANDYLVSKLTGAGIMPVMRVYTPGGAPVEGDLEALVKHYLPMGVKYYQLYNEPNLSLENQGQPPDVNRYLDLWLPAAKAVARAGGLPGFGALAPGGEVDDLQFLRQALDGIKQRHETSVLDRAWLSMHNYMFNRPLEYDNDSNGFAKFRWYDQIVREKVGRSLPIIGTEGGAHVGAHNDGSLPPLDENEMVNRMLAAYARTGSGSEPYNFAYTYWLIANEAGGGTDPQFTDHALFRKDGTSPLVEALKRHG